MVNVGHHFQMKKMTNSTSDLSFTDCKNFIKIIFLVIKLAFKSDHSWMKYI